MKELIKYIVGLAIVIIVCWSIGSRIFKGEILTDKNNVADIVKIDNAAPEISKDKKGNTHAEKEVIYLPDKDKEAYLSKEIDSLKDVINVQSKQIVGLTTANSKFRYEIKYITDTANKRYVIDQKDKWFTVKGIIPGPDPIVIEGRDSLTLAFIAKGRKRYANISSSNPAIEYYGLRSFFVPDKNTFGIGFGIDSQSTFDRNFKHQKINFGAGLKFMYLGDDWMYDISANYRYHNVGGLYPYLSIGIYKKIF